MVGLVLRALTLAMGVSVTVLTCLGKMDSQSAAAMLGIGLACAGVAMLEQG